MQKWWLRSSWLIYITIWQHLRREGCNRRTGAWPTRKEKKNKGPRRHYCSSSGLESDCLLTSAAVKLASIKPKEEKTLLKYVLENGIIKLCTICRKRWKLSKSWMHTKGILRQIFVFCLVLLPPKVLKNTDVLKSDHF